MDEYIDREAALMKLMQDGCSAKNLQSISDMPAADVAPVIHAHWTGSNGTYCSHCERSYMDVADADSWESSDIPDFCPYCGAQMDEKEG